MLLVRMPCLPQVRGDAQRLLMIHEMRTACLHGKKTHECIYGCIFGQLPDTSISTTRNIAYEESPWGQGRGFGNVLFGLRTVG